MKTVILSVVALLGVGVVVWYLMQPPVADAPGESAAPTEPAAAEAEPQLEPLATSGEGTLYALFASRESGTCSITTVSGDLQSSGTVWFASGKFAIESQTRVDGELYLSNMINDGARTYLWSGTAAGTMAIVMDSTDTMATTDTAAASPDTLDPNTVVRYDCQAWTEDPARFVPPSSITFTDMNDIQQGAFEGMMRGAPEGLDF